MFESMPRLELQAKQLLLSYMHFVDKSAAPALAARRTDTPFVGDVQGLALELDGFARAAREVEADPEFQLLPQEVRRDVIALGEEAEVAVVEIKEICEPDEVWFKAGRDIKQNASNRLRSDPADIDLIRARLSHELRKQHGGKPVVVYVPKRPKPDPKP